MKKKKNIENYVQNWNKFEKVREILLLRLVEIETGYQEGKYEQFSNQELKKLILALFNDSPKRQKFLETIQKN